MMNQDRGNIVPTVPCSLFPIPYSLFPIPYSLLYIYFYCIKLLKLSNN